MPRSPEWFQHIPAALKALRVFSAPVVDRASLEKLLHVSRRSAVRLMSTFGGYQTGRTFLIGRDNLIHAMEAVLADEAYRFESQRRQRLSEYLDRTRQDLRALQVKLPVAPEPAPGLPCPPA